MQDKQNEIRNRLNAYIEQGRKAKWVAEQVCIDPSLLCRFRKGKDLWEDTLQVIEEFLNKHQSGVL